MLGPRSSYSLSESQFPHPLNGVTVSTTYGCARVKRGAWPDAQMCGELCSAVPAGARCPTKGQRCHPCKERCRGAVLSLGRRKTSQGSCSGETQRAVCSCQLSPASSVPQFPSVEDESVGSLLCQKPVSMGSKRPVSLWGLALGGSRGARGHAAPGPCKDCGAQWFLAALG